MTQEDEKFIRYVVIQQFSWMDIGDAEKLYNALQKDICKDIEDTADPERWYDGDILIALKRTLFKKLHID